MSTRAHTNWLPLVLSAGLSALGWLYAEFVHNDRDTLKRVSALEQAYQDEQNELHEMHDELNQLTQWALGSSHK